MEISTLDFAGLHILAIGSTLGLFGMAGYAGHLKRKVKSLSKEVEIARTNQDDSNAKSAQVPSLVESSPSSSRHSTNHGKPSKHVRIH